MTEQTDPHGPTYDPHARDLSPERAYELYEGLRAQCPVARGEKHGGYWTLSRYEDVRAAAMDHGTYSSTGGVYVPAVSDNRFPPIDYDPPEHEKFRRLIAPLTSAAAARRMEPQIQATVDRLIAAFHGSGEAELVEGLALPLPLDVITRLYDLGPQQAEEIREYSLDFLEHASDEQGRKVIDRVCAYWVRLFEQRRKEPGDDFISQLLTINDELGVNDGTLANMMFILTYAGHDSTALGLSNVLLHLAEHPQTQQRLIDEPKLIPTAIDEILRYETPLHWFPRQLTADACVAGQQMSAGDRVILLFASANRDGRVFENPDEVVIDRKPNKHLAFGAGIHSCPGMPLAKAEIRIAVQTLLERIPGFRINGEVERTDPLEGGGRHLGVRRLPVTW
ncbi:cytochrome P450 [Streptomyces sp. NPDC047117]|uniref:cytochrome P450 n=1 Tax=unclassified Streptomyces TaxID=2593676 RepID=UPI003406905D